MLFKLRVKEINMTLSVIYIHVNNYLILYIVVTVVYT